MNEIVIAKETAGDLPKETPKSPETQKEQKIQKLYKIFGRIQNISLAVLFILGLFFIGGSFIENNSLLNSGYCQKFDLFNISCHCYYDLPVTLKNNYDSISTVISIAGNILTLLLIITFLITVLSLITGILLYVVYLYNRTDKTKKTYGKKFILRGIIGVIVFLIIYFAVAFMAGDIIWGTCLPRLLE